MQNFKKIISTRNPELKGPNAVDLQKLNDEFNSPVLCLSWPSFSKGSVNRVSLQNYVLRNPDHRSILVGFKQNLLLQRIGDPTKNYNLENCMPAVTVCRKVFANLYHLVKFSEPVDASQIDPNNKLDADTLMTYYVDIRRAAHFLTLFNSHSTMKDLSREYTGFMLILALVCLRKQVEVNLGGVAKTLAEIKDDLSQTPHDTNERTVPDKELAILAEKEKLVCLNKEFNRALDMVCSDEMVSSCLGLLKN